ncbi:MAG: lytic transglycosylase, partial [Methylophilaceae bacterium]
QYTPTEVEIDNAKSQPAFQRAIELERLGLRWESRAEWSYAIKGMNDKQLLAAAELATRQGWLDVAINTADKTQHLHNDGLRYPLPYREVVENFSRNQQLDAAWVYGLSRQESRVN